MKPLNIEATHDTPMVHFDKYTNQFEITGASLPPNIFEFYNPLLEWLKGYCKNPNAVTHLKLRFEYLNTSSTKMILNIISVLESITKKGRKVEILWYYDSGDLEMKEMGEEFATNCSIPFSIITD